MYVEELPEIGERVIMKSEITRLREQITLNYAAAYNGLYGLAEVAKVPHLHRTKCTERISEVHVQLAEMVGIEEATKIVADTLNAARLTSSGSASMPPPITVSDGHTCEHTQEREQIACQSFIDGGENQQFH